MKIDVAEIKNNEGIQFIEIPENFKIDDSKVFLKKNGNIISIIPYHSAWQNLYESLEQFTPDFMDERRQPHQQNRETFK